MLKSIKHIFILIALLLLSFATFSQEEVLDSLSEQKNREELRLEQRQLNFQKFFFESLQQKAIGNYDKAITALEQCQNIKPNEMAVSFELSKNYFAQEKYVEAIAYAERALEIKPNNLFLLQHLKDIYVKGKNYREALFIQQKIVVQKPSSQADLIILYIRNNMIDEARNLLIDLENKDMLSENLIPFKKSLFPTENLEKVNQSIEELSLIKLKNVYANQKTFSILRQILLKQDQSKQYIDLEQEGKEAIEIFPAQPFVYLMYAKALNRLKKYEEAIGVLQIGMDYVVDDVITEADFYEQLSLSYKGLSKNVRATKYYNLAVETRQKKS